MCERGDCHLSKTICTVTIDVVQALALERAALRQQIEQRDRAIEILQSERDDVVESQTHHRRESALSERSETTYLRIVGGLLQLLLSRNASGTSSSNFTTQEAVIGALVERHGNLAGISERTLLAKFAAANRALARD